MLKTQPLEQSRRTVSELRKAEKKTNQTRHVSKDGILSLVPVA